MHIDFIEISNFRKLLAVRIDIAKRTTVFVGANNSGKSSGMVVLRRFLVDHGEFSINDFTLSHWAAIDALGQAWEAETDGEEVVGFEWGTVAPTLDLWLSVPDNQVHFVQKILPTLDWDGSAIGVRLCFEPKKMEDFKREYLADRASVKAVLGAADASAENESEPFSLWPKSMIEFLSRRLNALFEVKSYLLDPASKRDAVDGEAFPQVLPPGSEPLPDDPFKGLIRVDEISAQRGLGMPMRKTVRSEEEVEGSGRVSTKLSAQLRGYYSQHLDPFDQPEADDIRALQAVHAARVAFGKQLTESFAVAIRELEGIGYPGLTDPKLSLAADLRPLDALRHGSALNYEVPTHLADVGFVNRLPEDSNGLGYQNLVSMVFALMGYRDKWMRVGKAGKKMSDEVRIPRLHLVLVEEPEAHLHAQVQQVFISHAYSVLRKHDLLGDSEDFQTQMVVSTHSSHVAHEAEFSSLRYFRRMPLHSVKGSVPTSRVIGLSRTFGDDEDTKRFVRRYLKVTHCDLFFADGAILVEGPAERILVPHMVRSCDAYKYLTRCYITWLEIGGSHAHRLKSLLTDLGLNTLVITDLDAKSSTGAKVVPTRGDAQITRNYTLKTWVPGEERIDGLLDAKPESLAAFDKTGFGVRVAYQQPTKVTFGTDVDAEALANTFEDALVYRNVEFFQTLPGTGLARRFRDSVNGSANLAGLAARLDRDLATGDKAEFAMNILEDENLKKVHLPDYIDAGLLWLIDQLRRKEDNVAGRSPIIPSSDAADAPAQAAPA